MLGFHQGRQLTLSLVPELEIVLKEPSDKCMKQNGAGDNLLQEVYTVN